MTLKTEQLELLGDRVLVLLAKIEEHTITESGIFIPKNEVYESEGGKLMSRPSSKKHLSIGTIIAMSPLSHEKLPSLSIGDKVLVTETANSPSYQFFLDRDRLVNDFDGYICIPHILIEAKINDKDSTPD